MFKDKELRKLLNDIKVINASETGTHYEFSRLMSLVEDNDKLKNRISELEAKVEALMELLAVKEVKPETEKKLKKGNKEVVIGKKFMTDMTEYMIIDK